MVITLAERFESDIEPCVLTESEVIEIASITMTQVAIINSNADVVHPGNM
jgi:hypothetical protein